MARKRKARKTVSDFLRQDNARGYGLARDVAAGQARETPRSRNRRRMRGLYRDRRTYRA
jgi:hypothetical protein